MRARKSPDGSTSVIDSVSPLRPDPGDVRRLAGDGTARGPRSRAPRYGPRPPWPSLGENARSSVCLNVAAVTGSFDGGEKRKPRADAEGVRAAVRPRRRGIAAATSGRRRCPPGPPCRDRRAGRRTWRSRAARRRSSARPPGRASGSPPGSESRSSGPPAGGSGGGSGTVGAQTTPSRVGDRRRQRADGHTPSRARARVERRDRPRRAVRDPEPAARERDALRIRARCELAPHAQVVLVEPVDDAVRDDRHPDRARRPRRRR